LRSSIAVESITAILSDFGHSSKRGFWQIFAQRR